MSDILVTAPRQSSGAAACQLHPTAFHRPTLAVLVLLFLALLHGAAAIAESDLIEVNGAPRAAGSIVLRAESDPGIALGPFMEFLVDSGGGMSLQQVMERPASEPQDANQTAPVDAGSVAQWQQLQTHGINGGFTDAVYWVRFTVENVARQELPWVLEINYPILDAIEFYTPDPRQGYIRAVAGDQVPFRERAIAYRHVAFPVDTPAQSRQTFYLRFATETAMNISLNLWPGATFYEAIDGQLLVFGFIYGLLTLATLYCLINALLIHELIYIHIALTILGALGYSLGIHGFGFQYLWPENLWLQSVCVPFLLNICYSFGMFYSRQFLNLRKTSPRSDKVIIAFAVFCLAMAALSLVLNYGLVIRVATVSSIVLGFAILWIGSICFLDGNKSARYFLLGWMVLVIGMVTFALKSLGLIASNTFTEWMPDFGFAGLALFSTLAQSDRFFQTQRRHITEQGALMKAIRSAEKKYRSLFENAIEGIFQVSLDGHLVSANAAFARILGSADVNDLLAQPHPPWSLHCLPEGERDKFKSLLDKEQAVKNFETSFILPSGETRWIAVSALLVRGKLDDASHYEGTMADITETRKRQQAEKQQRMAEASTEAKSLFLANMSHEIRTPMNAIIGFTDLALQHNQDPRLTDYLRKTRVASSNLLGIINDILDFSKIEAGKLEIEHIPFSLQEVLNNLSNLVSVSVATRQLALEVTVDQDIPDALVGDPLRIGQVLLNLTNNAIKFTPRGQVRVAMELVSLNKREMSIVLRGSVRDTGIGIPAEKLATLFSSFTQVDESTTRRFGGTGLGLSISKQLVGMMGGELGVESELGKGSTFSFTLACKLQDRRQRQNPHFLSSQLPLNILVVDDQQEARELLEKALISLAHNVTCVNSSAVALRELREKQEAGTPYDVLLTDWLMPDTDGIRCCRQVREDASLTTPRLVIVTGYDLDEVKKNAQGAGIDAFLAKPVKVQELSKVLQAVFQDRRTDQTQIAATSGAHVGEHVGERFGEHFGEHYFRGLRVLVVEDVVMNQELAREILESKGIVVSLANNGEEGVTAVAEGDFDLVLMDMQMPVMDGCQASEGIRRFNRKLPIIAMTANAMAADKHKCLAAGMNDYVTKPINTEELFAVMARWVKGRSPPSAPHLDLATPEPAAPQPAAPEPAAPEPAAAQPAVAQSSPLSLPTSTSATAALPVAPAAGAPSAAPPSVAPTRAAPTRPATPQPATLPSSLPGLAIAEGLKRCMGNSGLYLRFLSDFRRDQAASGASFRSFIEAGDMVSVKALGHKLKGLAGNLAAREVAAAAAALEKAPSAPDAALALTAFEAELQIFLASIEQLLPQPPVAQATLSATAPVALEKPKTALATPTSSTAAPPHSNMPPGTAQPAAPQPAAPEPAAPEPAAPQPAAPESAVPLFTRDELAARLDALLPLIRARKISAYDLAQEYQSQWPLVEQAALLGDLCTALDAFDFAQAEQLLESLRQGLGT